MTVVTFAELLERIKTEKVAIHTPTEEQAKTLLTELDKNGYTWCGGDKLTTETHYEDENESTCYNFEPNNKISYCSLVWYQENDYTIIEFADIDFKEK